MKINPKREGKVREFHDFPKKPGQVKENCHKKGG